jgi:cyclopropane fatty-acyl-phospholipid synthase-like methyltransferase
MVEAVGQAYWPSYFGTVARLLKPGGRACVQSIVIDDALFERYVQGTDFIQQYVFPGGCLPSPARFRAAAQQAGCAWWRSLPLAPTTPRPCAAGTAVSPSSAPGAGAGL